MTIFGLSTSKNSLSEETGAAAAVTLNNSKKFGRTPEIPFKTTTEPKKIHMGYPIEATVTDRNSQSATMEHERKEHQVGLAHPVHTNSNMIPLTCGEVPSRHRTYSSSNIGHHTRALGMVLFLIVVFSSTSSVLCVPLEHPELTGSFLPTKQREQSPYVLQSKGRLYLPSILNPPQDDTNDPQLFTPRLQLQENEDESIESDNEWETVIDPHLYVLTEWNSNPILQQQRTRRNAGPSLSIVNPLDVLRQRLLLEIARRRMRQTHKQIMDNAEILKNIGRRK